ncbi:MAG: hypothetical protein JXA20_19285 [Spirochaetes bacterium]|nr:hypothetical protein [Spirochaetota bacterium]
MTVRTIRLVLFLLPTILILLLVSCGGGGRSGPAASRGRIDLSSFDFKNDIARLDGEWDFYWERLLKARDLSGESTPAEGGSPGGVRIHVPGQWNDIAVNGKAVGANGYATYRLRVRMPYDTDTYAFKLIDCGTAYRLFAGDRELAANGVVAKSAEEYRPEYRPLVAPFRLDPAWRNDDFAEFDIVVQVANYQHRLGGLWESIRLGTFRNIRGLRDSRLILEVFLMGVIAIMMLYHVGLFATMRENRSALYFALTALFMGIRVSLTGERVMSMFLPDIPWGILVTLEYALSFSLPAPIILFLDHLFGNFMKRKLNAAVILLGGLVFLAPLVTPVPFFTRIKIALEAYTVLGGLYGLGYTGYLSARRVKGAFTAFLGLAAFYITGINDVLYGDMIINTMFLAPVGLFFFILSQSWLLSVSFSRAFKLARSEMEKNREQNTTIQMQNDFIKNSLNAASASILDSSRIVSSGLDSFRENQQDHASYTGEVASSIEEVTAATHAITESAVYQDRKLTELDGSIKELAQVISSTETEVSEALAAIRMISQDARTGNEAIGTMGDSINTIFESSAKVNGIIQIINDISDRINLLSLNAAIEAARAGDSGRGFAVVADEISKLADQTAASIKEIDRLIKTNDTEIQTGASNINRAVESVSAIISNIEVMNRRIATISDSMQRQLALYSSITGGADTVRQGSIQIRTSMDEQRTVMEEITKTVGVISDVAQRNSETIEAMSHAAKSLVDMVNSLNRDISEYEA